MTKDKFKKMTIDELVIEAKRRRSIKHPFKKFLIDYLIKVSNR